MATLAIVNPRRKRRKSRRRKSAARRRRSARILRVASNPKRRRRRGRKSAVKLFKRRRRGGSRSVSVRGLVGSAQSLAKNAGYAAVGAIALDLAWAYLPMPAQLRSGYVRFVAKFAGAMAIGIVGEKIVGRETAAKLALGAATVVLHSALREIVGQFAPQVSLGGVGESDFPSMGYYGSAPVAGMNEYDVAALPDYYGQGYSTSGNFAGNLNEYVNAE